MLAARRLRGAGSAMPAGRSPGGGPLIAGDRVLVGGPEGPAQDLRQRSAVAEVANERVRSAPEAVQPQPLQPRQTLHVAPVGRQRVVDEHLVACVRGPGRWQSLLQVDPAAVEFVPGDEWAQMVVPAVVAHARQRVHVEDRLREKLSTMSASSSVPNTSAAYPPAEPPATTSRLTPSPSIRPPSRSATLIRSSPAPGIPRWYHAWLRSRTKILFTGMPPASEKNSKGGIPICWFMPPKATSRVSDSPSSSSDSARGDSLTGSRSLRRLRRSRLRLR